MNRKYMEQLVDEAEQIDPQNEILEEENCAKRLEEMKKDINETIEYLDTCSRQELFWASEILEELSEHFKSKKLIECVERNVMRFSDKELQDILKTELEYMRSYI